MDEHEEQSPGVRPMVFPAWGAAAPAAEAPAPAPVVEEPAPASSPREEVIADILRAAAKDVPLASDVDLGSLAADLDRFSAADCAALIREAALAAMRESLDAAQVTAAHVATARERIRGGLRGWHNGC